MDYQVIEPSAALQPFIKCFWTLKAEATPSPVRQRVVPDGCMEMIFNYGDRFYQYLEDGSVFFNLKVSYSARSRVFWK